MDAGLTDEEAEALSDALWQRECTAMGFAGGWVRSAEARARDVALIQRVSEHARAPLLAEMAKREAVHAATRGALEAARARVAELEAQAAGAEDARRRSAWSMRERCAVLVNASAERWWGTANEALTEVAQRIGMMSLEE